MSNFQKAPSDRQWQGIPGLEVTPGGRIFISWFSGGTEEPTPDNETYLCQSDDHGKTFTDPIIMASPDHGTRAFDPTLWLDPNDTLWYIFNRGNKETATHTIHARTCDNPDAEIQQWSSEFQIELNTPYVFRMNKPTVLSTDEWILPVTHATETIHDWFAGFAGIRQLQGVAISSDEGKSWKLHGAAYAPPWALESMVTELKDGRLWMLIRAGDTFLWECFSDNKGKCWSTAQESTIASPGSRFYIRRLASGNLLLVNHYDYEGRSNLTAQISSDDGKTWNKGLLLDERSSVSYPDGIEDKSGIIRMVYDRERYEASEILMATFTEEDVVAGKDISGKLKLKQSINILAHRIK